jgi:hypothetical protein
MGDLKLNGATSGTITVTPTAVAGTTTITLPASTGTVALTASPTFTGTTTVASLSATGTISSVGAASLGLNGASSGYVTAQGSANTTNTGFFGFYTYAGTRQAYIGYIGSPNDALNIETDSGSNKPIRFATNSTEAMRIDTSGNLLVGTTSSLASARISVKAATNVIITQCDNGSGNVGIITTNVSGTAAYNGMLFANNGTTFSICGGISVSGTTTAFNTSSDYRLKENVAPLVGGLQTINSLRPITHDWISDKTKGEGFLAHELQAVVPLAVTGDKDGLNEDGSIKLQGVDYSKVVVHLVAAIQELSAKNDALEARLAALEAK